MPEEMKTFKSSELPGLEQLAREVKTTGKPVRIVTGDEELAVLQPPGMAFPLNYDLVAEVDKMRRVPGIVFAWGSFERVPRIAGTGIEVFEVIGVYKGVDGDWERLKQAFDFLTEDQLKAALHYYREYREEVDARLEEEAQAFRELKHERRNDPYHR
ncbi:MAG TPA: DUF433 domain-containing protein [Dehalococcoidia bacterium]|nr:DUF433 domain-containing protein [Dehalococcoidia bacterium]